MMLKERHMYRAYSPVARQLPGRYLTMPRISLQTPWVAPIFLSKAALLTVSGPQGDLFIAPHHIILCLLQDPDISCILKDFGLNVGVLRTLTKDLRRRKVITQWTKGRWDILEQYVRRWSVRCDFLTDTSDQVCLGPDRRSKTEQNRPHHRQSAHHLPAHKY